MGLAKKISANTVAGKAPPLTRPSCIVNVDEAETAVWLNVPPVPKGRPRLGRGNRTFTPKRTLDFEKAIKTEIARVLGKPRVLLHEVALELRFVLPTLRRMDIDNLCKGVMDALNGVMWKDDSQVFKLTAIRILKASPVGIYIGITKYQDKYE